MRVLFLDLDTLRPDHLGCYGYGRNTSPNIDSVAAQGVRFNKYYCSDAPCLPSRAALMSGRFGIHTGVVGHGGTAGDMRLEGESRKFADIMRSESLPAIFRQAGFRTVTISPFAERHSAWWFYAGFNEAVNTGKGGMESGEEITPSVLKWVENNAEEDNWFLHINYWDAHTPYRAPLDYGNPFENKPLPDNWINEEIFAQHLKKAGPHGAQDIMMYHNKPSPAHPRHPGELKNLDDVKLMIDGYDTGIKYMDEQIGLLFDALRKKGVFNDLAIIISSDHGENMGELGIYGEHATADNITPHIPMIIKWPGCKAGHVDNGLHYNLDLAPTLAELFGQNRRPSWDGQSYAKTITDGADTGRDYLVLGQCAHVCQRGVRFKNWMYIRTYHDGYHLFPDEMLFDVENDKHELTNLAETRKDVCMEAVYLLNQWHDDMMKTMKYDVDPLWTVIKEGGPTHAKGHLKKYCERLEESGRGYAIEELKRRHPREFK